MGMLKNNVPSFEWIGRGLSDVSHTLKTIVGNVSYFCMALD